MLLFVIPDRWVDQSFHIRQQVGMFFPMMMLGLGSVFAKFFYPDAWALAELLFPT